MTAKHNTIMAMYPMLSLVYRYNSANATTLKLVEYIEMIDCLNKSNK